MNPARYKWVLGVLVLLGPTAPATALPAQSAAGAYIVLEASADGTVTPLYVARVPLLPDTTFAARIGPAVTAANEPFVVRLRDRRRRIVYENSVEVARTVRGEFHSATGDGIDGHHLTPARRVFVVRTPLVAGATVEVSSAAPGAAAARIDLDRLLDSQARADAGLVAEAATAGQLAALPGWDNGPSGNRVDLLVVGDGYTAAEQGKFASDALTVVDGMFGISPYAEYRNFVNVSTLFVASEQSGADEPPYAADCSQFKRAQTCCGDSSAPATATYVNTAFDATFCSYNIERLLTVDAGKVLVAAAVAPEWDQILMIVNSSRYGGSGGGFSVISTNLAAVAVAQHEYGHTFTRLADEYSTAYPGYPSCSDVVPGASPCERNVTDETARELVKWARWIAPTQAVPSSGPPPVASDAGLWAGARYQTTGMYRQGYLCIMRALGAPFCDVGSEAYVLRLSEGGWGVPSGGIDWIEPGTESPAPGNVSVTWPGALFSAVVVGPEGGTPLDARWYLDGIEQSAESVPTGATVAFELVSEPGLHSVELRVVDTSAFVHPTLRDSISRSRVWNVEIMPPPTTTLSTTTTLAPTTTVPPSTTTVIPPTTSVTTTTTTTTTTTIATTSTTTTLAPTTTTTLPATTTSTTREPTTTTTLLPSTTLSPTTTTYTTTSTTLAELRCAQPVTADSDPRASDCLFILNAAVGATACLPECICAPKGSLPALASDALLCLRKTVGEAVELNCPCGPVPSKQTP